MEPTLAGLIPAVLMRPPTYGGNVMAIHSMGTIATGDDLNPGIVVKTIRPFGDRTPGRSAFEVSMQLVEG